MKTTSDDDAQNQSASPAPGGPSPRAMSSRRRAGRSPRRPTSLSAFPDRPPRRTAASQRGRRADRRGRGRPEERHGENDGEEGAARRGAARLDGHQRRWHRQRNSRTSTSASGCQSARVDVSTATIAAAARARPSAPPRMSPLRHGHDLVIGRVSAYPTSMQYQEAHLVGHSSAGCSVREGLGSRRAGALCTTGRQALRPPAGFVHGQRARRHRRHRRAGGAGLRPDGGGRADGRVLHRRQVPARRCSRRR